MNCRSHFSLQDLGSVESIGRLALVYQVHLLYISPCTDTLEDHGGQSMPHAQCNNLSSEGKGTLSPAELHGG